MRFYQLEVKQNTAVSEDVLIVETVTHWFGTERDAVIARNQMFKEGKLVGLKREQVIYPVDVPTDKAGLLKFLQDNVTNQVIV